MIFTQYKGKRLYSYFLFTKEWVKINSCQNCKKIFLILFLYELINATKWLILEIYYYLGSIIFIEIIYSILTIIIVAGYLSLLERQVVAVIQQRVGPSLTGGLGALLQPLSDGFKLLIKEIILPSKSKLFLFLLAPIYTITFTIALWAGIPITSNPTTIIINKEFSILIILYHLSLNSLFKYHSNPPSFQWLWKLIE